MTVLLKIESPSNLTANSGLPNHIVVRYADTPTSPIGSLQILVFEGK